jgi:N-acetylglutamate synthase-like GNAT family acetyltransferase
MQVKPPQSEEEFARYFELRWQVLREPWGQPRGSERDELEDAAEHALIVDDDGRPLAVGRLHFNSPTEAQIRYMAVAETARGRGLGRQIVEYLEAIARRRGATTIVLNARHEVTEFYARLGYATVGKGPTLFGTVAHRRMLKRL